MIIPGGQERLVQKRGIKPAYVAVHQDLQNRRLLWTSPHPMHPQAGDYVDNISGPANHSCQKTEPCD